MEIRYVMESDSRAQISFVYEQSWKYAYRGIIPKEYLDSIPEGRWATQADKAGMNTLVALDDGRIVGTSSFCASRFPEMNNCGEIVSIYLLPEYIGKGCGKVLLDKAEEGLRHMGYDSVFLWVLEDNGRARRFYEKNGFICGERYLDDKIGGKALREVMYKKDVTF